MKWFAILAVLLAVLSGILFQGTFGHLIVVMASGIYLGVPLALFLALWLAFALVRTGAIPRGLRNTFLVSAVLGVCLFVSIGTGSAVHRWKIHAARTYVKEIIPALDAYRKEHGRYPETLAELGAASPPRLLSESHCYSSETDSFRFEYWDPAGIMDGYCFESATREWTYFD